MNFDFSIVLQNLSEMGNGLLAQLPNIVIGLILFIIFIFLARLVRGIVKKAAGGFSQQASIALGRIALWAVLLLGLLIALTVIFPSVDIETLIGLLGVSGVAIGFAFRDILQNFFAGLIILFTEPFHLGDQIIVGDFEGTVKQIDTRATTIRTYDGRDVLIPNADLFTDSVTVNTAQGIRRSQYDIGVGYGDDIDLAKQVILEAMQGIETIKNDPAPEALVVALADSTINIRARWWTDAQQATVIHTFDKVVSRSAEKLVENGMDLPFPTHMVLFHDQTEETDGDRAQQREGWPVPRDGKAPRPRRVVDMLE